ncbi:uncharacterized protein [Physcomitrium patens]|uniref:Gustatory receptor n=1 Tax=Physcomitrium patens TaxID=3218 RepID=A0A2K1IH58_PHYPA|nr:uncharacterized protein LOC112276589 [Physcomitrium patens]XP_024363777.1 uncharacterized protein LOC112276589 [Physcomitrium patens]PNR28612.1 hypothetical protein PHYPA_029204 [Physcomitrium patens]|eukprot:XP_024363776.1 uncharacterized protein LOC112276589 [Physcomitrella patens]
MEEVYEAHDSRAGFVEDRLQHDAEESFIVKGVHFSESEDDFDPSSKLESKYRRMSSNPRDELVQFRSGLAWLGLDQSTIFSVIWSRILFVLLAVVVPIFNFNFVSCDTCDESRKHPFEKLVQASETVLATVSFLTLSHILRRFGLRRTLLLDKIVKEPSEVQEGFQVKLKTAFSLLAWMLLPTFLVELGHRAWWYYCVTIDIPFLADVPKINAILLFASILSWLYRTSVFLFMCVLFRLMCSLQILRLRAYNKLLELTSEVSIILKEHMKIRNQLTTISHRFRVFLILALFTIIFSQLSSLFQILLSAKSISFFRAGDLAVCSLVQLTGLVLCLQGAAKITHKAQHIVASVSRWHALATCSPSVIIEPTESNRRTSMYGPAHPLLHNRGNSSEDLEASTRDLLFQETLSHDLEAFQKRQALVTYLQHTRAGISLYGFVLDRGFLYMIFVITFTSTLFVLGKTILA